MFLLRSFIDHFNLHNKWHKFAPPILSVPCVIPTEIECLFGVVATRNDKIMLILWKRPKKHKSSLLDRKSVV